MGRKRQDVESKIFRASLTSMGIAFIIMMAGMVMIMSAGMKMDRIEISLDQTIAEFDQGMITQSEYNETITELATQEGKAKQLQVWGIVVYFSSIFVGIFFIIGYALVIVWNFKEFKAVMAGKDCFEADVSTDITGPYKYQIDTPRDSSQKVEVIMDFIEMIRGTSSYFSILNSIQNGGGEIQFNQAYLMQQISSDLKKVGEELKSSDKYKAYLKQQQERKNNDAFEDNSYSNNYGENEPTINLNGPIDPKLFLPLYQVALLKGLVESKDNLTLSDSANNVVSLKKTSWRLIFRKVDSMKCLDGEETMFDKVKGMYVLIPAPEKEIWSFPTRLSNDEYEIPISKCYTDFRFIDFTIGTEFALFICTKAINKNNQVYDLSLGSSIISTAEMEALGQFAYLAWRKMQGSAKDLQNKDSEINEMKGKIQEEKNKKANEWLDNKGLHRLGNFLEKRLEATFKLKINLTAIFLLISFLAIGFFIGSKYGG